MPEKKRLIIPARKTSGAYVPPNGLARAGVRIGDSALKKGASHVVPRITTGAVLIGAGEAAHQVTRGVRAVGSAVKNWSSPSDESLRKHR